MEENKIYANKLQTAIIVIIALFTLYFIVDFALNFPNKTLFKNAYDNLTTSITKITESRIDGELPLCMNGDKPVLNNSATACSKHINQEYPNSAKALCINLCEVMDGVSPDKKITDCKDICGNKKPFNYRTKDGMRWQFENYSEVKDAYTDPYDKNLKISNVFIVYVDVNNKNNFLFGDSPKDFINFDNQYGDNGVFYYDTGSASVDAIGSSAGSMVFVSKISAALHKLRNPDTFVLAIDKKGNIKSMTPVAYTHLNINK